MARPSPEERAQKLLAELREATSEAAGVVKDLHRAMREARAQVDEYLHDRVQADLDAHTASWQSDAQAFVDQARADTQHHAQPAVERAQSAIDKAASIEVLSELLAARMAAIYRRTPEGPGVLDYGSELGDGFIQG